MALQQAVPVRPGELPRRHHPDSAIGHYRAAARTLRAARPDLLATHIDPRTAEFRSPESSLLRHLGERGPVLRRLAGMVAAIAETEPLLRRLASHVGHPVNTPQGELPDLSEVLDSAHAAASTAGLEHTDGDTGVPARILEQATVARPSIRTNDPLVEITDRVTAIRRGAWDQLQQPDPSLHAITDIARLATHIEATRFRLTAHRAAPLTSVTAPKAGAWHQIWTELRQLRSLNPPDLDLRAHARAVEQLIARCARTGGADTIGVSGGGRRGARPGRYRNRRLLAAVLREAGDQLAQTAPWTLTTLDRPTSAGSSTSRLAPPKSAKAPSPGTPANPSGPRRPSRPPRPAPSTPPTWGLDAAYTGPLTGSVDLAPAAGVIPPSV